MGRQLTITLFFLVLMACLCLYIQMPATPGFLSFDIMLKRSASQANQAVDGVVQQLKTASDGFYTHDRVLPYYRKALQLKKKTEAIQKLLESYRQQVGFMEEPLWTRQFVRRREWSAVCQQTDSFVKEILSLIDNPGYKQDLLKKEISLACDSVSARRLFHNLPRQGAQAVLSAIAYNVAFAGQRTAEELLREAVAYPFCGFNPVAAVAVPADGYIYPGETLSARIFQAVYDRSHLVTIHADEGGQIAPHELGIAHWKGEASGFGRHVVQGTATLQLNDSAVTRSWSFKYFVARKAPGAYIFFDKTNVCYRGIPCVISLSTELYPVENLLLRVPGATVKKIAAGRFEIIAPENAPGKLLAYADARDAWGGRQTIACLQLIVKDAPPPVATIAGSNEEGIGGAALQESPGLVVTPALEDLQYEITDWQLVLIRKGHAGEEIKTPVKGGAFPPDALTGVATGDRLLAEDIVVRDNYNHSYSLSPVSVRVK